MRITFTFDFEKPTQLAWTLHNDNAPAHTALSIRQLLVEKNIATNRKKQCSLLSTVESRRLISRSLKQFSGTN